MAEGDELSAGLRVDDSRYADASCAVCGALWRRSHALLVPPIAKKIVLRSQKLPAARSCPLCLTGEEKCSGVTACKNRCVTQIVVLRRHGALRFAKKSVTTARRAPDASGVTTARRAAVPISLFQNNTGTCSECSGATPIQIVSGPVTRGPVFRASPQTRLRV